MAGIDYTIPGQFRGIQVESPMNAMAQAMQLRNLQETSEMNALKRQEAQEMTRQRNALAAYLANPKKPTDPMELEAGVRQTAPLLADQFVTQQLQRADLAERTQTRQTQQEKLQAEARQKKLDEFKTAQKDIAGMNSIEEVIADVERKKNAGILPDEHAQYILQGLPTDPAQFDSWKRRTLLNLVSAEKQFELTAPKPEKYDMGGKIVTIDMNPNSPSYNKEIRSDAKTAAPAAVTESSLAKLVRERTELAAKDSSSPMLKVYDDAIGKETGGAPPELVKEYLFAQKNNGFKGSLLDFKKQVAMAGRSVTHNAAPVQTVTVQGPNGPEMRDARTGRRITDDQGKPLVPYDASTKPLTPVQKQKLAKDRSADDAKITSAKDMADDIERNVDALLGNEKKKIKPHPGLSGITGYNAMLPSLPGGQPRAAQQLLDNVKGKVTMLGKNLASQEGKLGNMAVQEWKIVADALERIDPAAPNFPDQLRNVLKQARRLESNLKSRRNEVYAAEQPASENPIFSEADAVLRK